MRAAGRIGRLIAAVVTVVFAVIALPFIALSVGYWLAGVRPAGSTLLVLLLYSVVLLALAIFWLLQFFRRASPKPGGGAASERQQ